MATILDEYKSTGGSPYAYYTVTANTSNRTTNGVTISGTISARLASSSSSLQTGGTMGLNAFLTLNGVEQSGVNLKDTGTTWSGTKWHDTNYSFTINNLEPTQTSIPVSFRVSRTGSAENNYSKGAALQPTTCTSLTVEQGIGKSVFNSITNPTTNGSFSLSITNYSGYDVLTIKNGNTTIKTINGVTNGTAYTFTNAEQTALVNAIGVSNTSINLTATLETFLSQGGTSFGTTSKTMAVSLPAYTPVITITSVSDNVSAYNTYKNNSTDMIKVLSKPNISISMSNDYSNTYSSATCNGTSGTISNRTATFTNLTQANSYTINVTDSRGKVGSLVIDGSSYTSTIKTVQWFKGSLETDVYRPSPTGATAIVTVTPTIYDGTNLKTSALANLTFTFKYTQAESSEVTVQSSSFTESSGVYTYTISGLDPTKTVTWNITGTDLIGAATNGDSDTLGIGLPVFNAYKDNNGEQFFIVNGKETVKGDLDVEDDLNIGNNVNIGNALTIKNFEALYHNNVSNYTILCANAGIIYLRPNGTWSGTGQATLDTNGKLTVSGEVVGKLGSGYGQLRAVATNYGFFIRNDDGSTYFMLTNSGDANGSWNSLRPIYINNASGRVGMSNGLDVTGTLTRDSRSVATMKELYSNTSGATSVNIGEDTGNYNYYIISWGAGYGEKATDVFIPNFGSMRFTFSSTGAWYLVYNFSNSGNTISMSKHSTGGWGDIGKMFKIIGVKF